MVRFGNFEVEYNRNAPDKVSVRIETDDKGEVWLPKCDIARAYLSLIHISEPTRP